MIDSKSEKFSIIASKYKIYGIKNPIKLYSIITVEDMEFPCIFKIKKSKKIIPFQKFFF